MGHLELIFGSMYSGKTAEMLNRIRRYMLSGKKHQLFKPRIDNRYDTDAIVTHDSFEQKKKISRILNFYVDDLFNRDKLLNELYRSLGEAIKAEIVEHSNEILSLTHENTDVVGIDEIQFFDCEIIHVIEELVSRDKIVIVTGLDMCAMGKPFGNVIPQLACLAKYVTKLHAVCVDCGKDAYISYKLSDNPEKIDIGSYGKYIALCEDCAKKRAERT